jgi:hypothetical protein
MIMNKQNFSQQVGFGMLLVSMWGTSHADTLADPSDLFLNIYDMTTLNSYNVDLGITMTQFISSSKTETGTTAYSLGSAFTGIAGDSLEYNISAVNTPPNATDDPTFGYLISSPLSTGFPIAGSKNVAALNGGIVNPLSRIQDIQTAAFDTVLTNANGGLTAGFHVDWDLNSTLGISTSGVFNTTKDENGNAAPNALYIDAVTSPGTIANGGTLTTVLQSSKENINLLAGHFTLTSTGLDWVSSNTTVAAVPLPATSWLFLGGLASLLKLQKRKQA